MFQIGDRVKIKDSYTSSCVVKYSGEFEVVEIKNNNTCIISDGKERYTAFIKSLELIQKENKTVVFDGKVIELENGLGAKAIIGGIEENKIKVSLETETTGCDYYLKNIQETNIFLKSLGFKEVLESKFNLVNFLKENLEPKEFVYKDKNIFLYYDHEKEEVNWDYIKEDEMMGTVHFKEMEREKLITIVNEMNIQNIKSEQLKDAYKQLRWL